MSETPYTPKELTLEEQQALTEMLGKKVGTLAAESGMRERTALKKLLHKGFSKKSAARLKVKAR